MNSRSNRAAVAAAVIAGAGLIGAALLAGGLSPTSSPSPTASADGRSTTAPVETASVAAQPIPLVVYFARDDLPPFRATALGNVAARNGIEDRISARLTALWSSPASTAPPGTSNPFAKSGHVGTRGQLDLAVRVDGDLATVTFDLLGGWGVTTAFDSRGLYQQLVWTITDEPGIRRALILDPGKPQAIIGTLTVSGPATREETAGYAVGTLPALTAGGTAVHEEVLDIGVAMDTDILTRGSLRGSVPGLGRVGIVLRPTGGPPAGRFEPRFAATLNRCDPPQCDGGKSILLVALVDASWPTDRAPYMQTFDRSPIRSVRVGQFQDRSAFVEIRLDAALPWRVATEALADGTALLWVDIGGHGSEVSESVAAYSPVPGQGVGDRASGCSCNVSGTARASDARVGWRVRDGNGAVVSHGTATTSRGDTAAWGVFTADVTIPPGVVGQVVLEVFTFNPRDLSPANLVGVPVTLH